MWSLLYKVHNTVNIPFGLCECEMCEMWVAKSLIDNLIKVQQDF